MPAETLSPSAVAVRNPKDLLQYLTRSRAAIEMALPKHLNPDRMMRLALTCFSTNPALRQCSPQSILASVVVASQLGLEPGIAGQGYLIPYKGQCTFVPGWQGLVSLLNNTGRATAWTGAVFSGDHWVFQLGSRPTCEHIPGDNYGDPEKLIWVYACGKVNGSEQPVIEAWPMSRVWKHRDRYNKVGQRHYSYEQPEMYARKVVLLQVLKYMPRSIELNNAITAADAAELGQTTRIEDSVVVIDPDPADIALPKPQFEPTPAAAPKAAAPAPAAAVPDDNIPMGDSPQGIAPLPPPPQPPPPSPQTTPSTPVPAPAEPEPPAPKREKRAKPVAGPGPKEMLIAAGVDCEDFTDWLVTTGRNAKAKDWANYDAIPEVYWQSLAMDGAGLAKCVTLYGQQAEPANAGGAQ